MDRPDDILVFTLGCCGALAPEVVRLYRLRSHPPKGGFSPFYYLISVVYALLGGVVALVLPAVTLHAALYAGITTSVVISAAARNTKQTPGPSADSSGRSPPSRKRRTFSELLRTHANGIFPQAGYDS